jgi:hypothetical protein
MNRNSLTTAVIAGIAGVAGIANMANAVYLNPDGVGQVLLYPYYTVNGQQQTLLSVVNTTSIGKAVKVRFLEGYNSREVLDFNLYLSKYDVWTAAVFSLADSGNSSAGDGAFAGIFTTDNSCTDPALVNSGTLGTDPSQGFQQFLNFKYVGSANSDTGPTSDARTREGHFEMITMGDIVLGSGLEFDITHTQPQGVPPDCDSADLQAASLTDIVAPGDAPINDYYPADGLYGSAAVVEVGNGTFFSYNADAIGAFSQLDLYTGPGNLTPNQQSVNEGASLTVTAELFSNQLPAISPYSGLVHATYPRPGVEPGPRSIDAVSALFEAQNVYNQYEATADGAIGTDWVVTFPTKNFYVDAQPGGHITGVSGAIPPFENLFDGGESCVTVGNGTTIFNREEGHQGASVCPISPCPGNAPNSSICLETNVIAFGASGSAASILHTSLVPPGGAQSIAPFGSAGWVNLDFSGFGHVMNISNEGNVFYGVPVTGFEAVEFINGNLNGELANYSGVYRHRLFRECSNALGACS